MSKLVTYPNGAFCWVDLATSDKYGAQDFYTQLFGWTAVDIPIDRGAPYTMLRKGNANVCALYPLPDDMGDHPSWNAYVSVTDAAASADAAIALGGEVIAPPTDIMRAGRMAVVQDPTGAFVSLWQPDEHTGADLQNEPGALCWVELQTRDLDSAMSFYRQLFGWDMKPSDLVPGIRYEIVQLAEREIGGMMSIREDWGPVPPNWAIYFCVADCDETVDAASRLGGKALFPAMEIEDVGRFAFLQDPQGAVFAVIQTAHPT